MNTARPMARPWLVAAVVIAPAAAGCTAETPPPASVPKPAPAQSTPAPRTASVTAFPPLAGRHPSGARIGIQDVAADGDRVVSVGQYSDGVSTATFGYSKDGGRTWRSGAAAATTWTAGEGASQVAVRTGRKPVTWVATGTAGKHFASWTSRDGTTWRRHFIDPAVIDPDTEDPGELVATSAGFFVVGRFVDAAGDSHPRIWASQDGVSWAERRLPGRAAVTGLAARDSILVAVGASDDDAFVWRSVDGGRTWAGVPRVPRVAIDEEFNRSLNDVAVDQRGFSPPATSTGWTAISR